MPRTTVFVCYSHSDARWLKRLQVHLQPLERQGLVELWDDTRIAPGYDWAAAIANAIASAKVAVLLVSADFLASPYISTNELPPLLASARADGAAILPVIVGPSLYEEHPHLRAFQAVNDPTRPLTQLRHAAREEVFVKIAKQVVASTMSPILQPERARDAGRSAFYDCLRHSVPSSIEEDKRLTNLSGGHWVYDDLIRSLASAGWIRFAAGFKAGVYGHPTHPWCIKILGMGVGDNPAFFCEHGYYLLHERAMLTRFREAGYRFQPDVMSVDDSIAFLIRECGVSRQQAETRSTHHDLLITRLYQGMPLLVQTGRYLDCELEPLILNHHVLFDIGVALETLKSELDDANQQGLAHNDPIAFNIVLAIGTSGRVEARLVDFELAQDRSTPSPGHVNLSVEKLYRERNVPFNPQAGWYTKSLDQHLIGEAIQMIEQLAARLNGIIDADAPFRSLSSIGPFYSGLEVRIPSPRTHLRRGEAHPAPPSGSR